MLILSLFCGLDLLGQGFQDQGFCVVQAGDIIMGKDIRKFKGIPGRFDGIIGGSPCQDFSRARRCPPTGYGLEMLNEFRRVVMECQPQWFLLENVPNVPLVHIENYQMQRFYLNANECGSTQNRHRFFQFGSLGGLLLRIARQPKPPKSEPCAMATEGTKTTRRTWQLHRRPIRRTCKAGMEYCPQISSKRRRSFLLGLASPCLISPNRRTFTPQ